MTTLWNSRLLMLPLPSWSSRFSMTRRVPFTKATAASSVFSMPTAVTTPQSTPIGKFTNVRAARSRRTSKTALTW